MELNAFSLSKSKTASVLFVPNISSIEFTTASHPTSCELHSYKFSTAFVASSFTMLMKAFPAFLRSTCPTPIGRTPGFLL